MREHHEVIARESTFARMQIDQARARDIETYGRVYSVEKHGTTEGGYWVLLAVGYPGHAVRTQVSYGATYAEARDDAHEGMQRQYREHVKGRPITATREIATIEALPETLRYPCAIAPSDVVSYSITDGGQIVAIHKITTKEGRVLWDEAAQ